MRTRFAIHNSDFAPKKHRALSRPTSRLRAHSWFFGSFKIFLPAFYLNCWGVPEIRCSTVSSNRFACQTGSGRVARSSVFGTGTCFPTISLYQGTGVLRHVSPRCSQRLTASCCHASPAHDAWLPFDSGWYARLPPLLSPSLRSSLAVRDGSPLLSTLDSPFLSGGLIVQRAKRFVNGFC